MPNIVLIEFKSSGKMTPAFLTEGEKPGSDCFRQKSFASANDLFALGAEDLYDLCNEFGLEANSPENAATLIWNKVKGTTNMYAGEPETSNSAPEQNTGEQDMASTKKAAKKSAAPRVKKEKAPKPESTGQRGRKSSYAGMKLYKLAKDNPRREGTHGHASFALITNGMTYEKFIEAGGRVQDLAWDVAKGNVEVRA